MLDKQSLHKQANDGDSHNINLKYDQSLLKYIVINMLQLLINMIQSHMLNLLVLSPMESVMLISSVNVKFHAQDVIVNSLI